MVVLSMISCDDASKKDRETSEPGTAKLLEGIDLQLNLRETDSVQAIFYNDPDGDPRRYTRFFRFTPTTDSAFIRPLLRSIAQPFQEYHTVKNCRSEGKAFLFKKGDENPLQTIYFSTRCDSCCYVYFIKDGRFYYMSMTDELTTQLKEARSRSVVPKVQSTQ